MLRVFVLLLLAALLFAAGSGWLALYPPVPVDLGGAENLDARAEKVAIPVGDGDALDGWLLEGTRPALIVIFHGYGRDHTRAWRYAQFLRKDGYSILTVDFRSSRARNRKPTTLGGYELEDARATLAWVRGNPRLSDDVLGIFGESLGGSVALVVASGVPEVRAVCTDAAFATGERAIADACWRWAHVPPWPAAPMARWLGREFTHHDPYALDALAAASAISSRPTLFIQSTQDDRFDVSQARDLWKAAGSDPDGLWIVEGNVGHNESWLKMGPVYEKRVREFFARSLLEAIPDTANRSPGEGSAPAAAGKGRG